MSKQCNAIQITSKISKVNKEMALKAFNFLKKGYADVEALWSLKIPKGKIQHKYNTVLEYCRRSQYFLAVLLFVPLIFWHNFWKLLHGATVRDGVALLISGCFRMEFMGWIVLGYVLGLKRLPANYISIAITKTFVVLDKTWKPMVQDFQAKVLEESRLVVVTYNPSGESLPFHSKLQSCCLFAVWIGSVWAIERFTKIDVSRHENCALISTTALTSTAAVLLMTTLSFDTFPTVVEFHRRCCELWVLSAVGVLCFIMLFLLQRLKRIINGEIKPSQYIRMWWESLLFILTVYIMLLYIPVIHKGFSTKNVIARNNQIVTRAVVPSEVSNVFQYLSELDLQDFIKPATKVYARLIQGSTYTTK